MNGIPEIEGPGDNFKLNLYLPPKINPVFVPMISIAMPMENEIFSKVALRTDPPRSAEWMSASEPFFLPTGVLKAETM